MGVKCDQSTILVGDDKLHVYVWKNIPERASRTVVLIHGLMMHGKSFDRFASHLAGNDSIVFAPDLRGFGRWYFAPEEERNKANFSQSLEDVSRLLRILKDKHPHLPLFLAGESLGAHFARHAASMHPELVDGLILSSPCERPRMLSIPLIPYTCTQLMLAGLDQQREFNLSFHAKDFLKDEPETLRQYLEDPMSRKSLEVLELIDSLRLFGSMKHKDLAPDIPILVLRGKNDCVCNINSTQKFVKTLKSSNLTFHNCKGCGHLILQAQDIETEILDKVVHWLAGLKR